MKLRNKKTGKIVDRLDITIREEGVVFNNDETYSSLAELIEVWEDYEEPKELDYWYIEANGEILQCHKPKYINHLLDRQKEIGNYFETREEAEKAVEKLKAWKRLKDKGFEFDVIPSLGHCDGEKFDISIIANMPAKWWFNDKVEDDIQFIFGDEE
jgi:hypothetical protein